MYTLFYVDHTSYRFFKDRHWLFTEFTELEMTTTAECTSTSAQLPAVDMAETPNDKNERRIFEIGCGVGNTIIPILKYNRNECLKVFGCDFSARAIEILKQHSDYDAKRCEVFVLDATVDQWQVPFAENTIEIIVLIFVLSAIHPDKYVRRNIVRSHYD